MDQKHKEVIEKCISDSFTLRGQYFDFHINTSFQLALAQLDLLRTISTIVIALLGIGYFFNEKFNSDFLLLSTILIAIVFMGTISFTRETIDSEDKNLRDNEKVIKEKTEETIEKAIQALKEDNSKLFFDYLEEKSKKKTSEQEELIYTGEIFNFFLYLSVFFLVLSYFSQKYSFGVFSYITVIALISSYVLSYTSWSSKLIKTFSRKLAWKKI